ncbi:hypothetical protein I4F81_012858 [Pyropia yezoensis]|uniref:Uncharacterized protein n=1 Tax=Pyropia yezoensis TaxID=2788 RepID=A0ACC3CJL9_PYRYE|nr:hypothetical protein I4F81_012858 [Neopyropia yezoensis]
MSFADLPAVPAGVPPPRPAPATDAAGVGGTGCPPPAAHHLPPPPSGGRPPRPPPPPGAASAFATAADGVRRALAELATNTTVLTGLAASVRAGEGGGGKAGGRTRGGATPPAGDALPRMRALRSRNRVLAREAAGGLAALDSLAAGGAGGSGGGGGGGGGDDAAAKTTEASRLRSAFEAAARDFRDAVTASVAAEAAAATATPAAVAAWAATGAAAATPGAAAGGGGGGGGRGLDGLPTTGSRRAAAGGDDEQAPLLSSAASGGAAAYGAPAPLAPRAESVMAGRRVDAAVREVRSTAALLASRDSELAAVAAASAETAAIMRDLAGMIGEQGDTVVEVAGDLDTAAEDVGRARAQLAKTAARKDLPQKSSSAGPAKLPRWPPPPEE